MKTVFLIISLCSMFFFSCHHKTENFTSLPADKFAEVISDFDVQRVDVRTLGEYSENHIPGSININVLNDDFALMADSLLHKDKPVAVYCRSGKRSKKAASILGKAGYEVYELDGGFNAWQEAGGFMEK